MSYCFSGGVKISKKQPPPTGLQTIHLIIFKNAIMKKQKFAQYIAAMAASVRHEDNISQYAELIVSDEENQLYRLAKEILSRYSPLSPDQIKERAKEFVRKVQNSDIQTEFFSGYYVGELCVNSYSGEEHEFQFDLSEFNITPKDDLSGFDSYIKTDFARNEGLLYVIDLVGSKVMMPEYFLELPQMKTALPDQIKSVLDAKKLFVDLIANGEVFNPDDDANEIIWNGVNVTKYEREQINRLMGQMWDLPGIVGSSNPDGFCPHGFILEYDKSLTN